MGQGGAIITGALTIGSDTDTGTGSTTYNIQVKQLFGGGAISRHQHFLALEQFQR